MFKLVRIMVIGFEVSKSRDEEVLGMDCVIFWFLYKLITNGMSALTLNKLIPLELGDPP